MYEKHITLKKVISKVAYNTEQVLSHIKDIDDELVYHLENTNMRDELEEVMHEMHNSLAAAFQAFEHAAQLANKAKDITGSKPREGGER